MQNHNQQLDLDTINNKYKTTKIQELTITYLKNIQALNTTQKYNSMETFFEQNLQELTNYPEYITKYIKSKIDDYEEDLYEERLAFYINNNKCKKTTFFKELEKVDTKTINLVYESKEPTYGFGNEDEYSLDLEFEYTTFKFRVLCYDQQYHEK